MKVFGIVGWKNSGKTGLVERLVSEFVARGFTVSTIKHAHHHFDIDQPGRDSFRHRQAGAGQVMLSSSTRWALMTENRDMPEPALAALLGRLDPVDLVLVEGFKAGDMAKIEAHRQATGRPLLAASDAQVLAVAADYAAPTDRPVMALDDTAGIADFIAENLRLAPRLAASDGSGDCFALPPGVDWVPVETALATLRDGLVPAVGTEILPLAELTGRVLAGGLAALRASPPAANSAVDGYGFARAGLPDREATLVLASGRAAPGAPWPGQLPDGQTLRILTGAPLPAGVDTVALQEHVALDGASLRIARPPRRGANTRQAGEDMKPGDGLLATGHLLRPPDIGLLAAAGHDRAPVFRRLRVAVLSTGDELIEPGSDAPPAAIYDANRPMLVSLLQRWGFAAVDLGRAGDSRDSVRAGLDRAAAQADVIVTSGGASAGDEDHIAALLRQHGQLKLWRIAVKPGRPLALGHWQTKPVFGLPGNPVAAFVCALIFARPALMALAGRPWTVPRGTLLPAAFTKLKRPGRREYLRARLNDDGRVEVFKSEGSGRITGLSWATGLCELDDGAAEIAPGTPVRFLAFADFGI